MPTISNPADTSNYDRFDEPALQPWDVHMQMHCPVGRASRLGGRLAGDGLCHGPWRMAMGPAACAPKW